MMALRLRDFPTGSMELDTYLDEMFDAIRPATTPEAQALPFAEGDYFAFKLDTNTSSLTLLVGNVIGFTATGLPAWAYGLSGSTQRPVAIVAQTAPPDADLTLATAGLIWVSVETGLATAKGELCYVSASQAGATTNVRPSAGNTAYPIGMFVGVNDTTDRSPVILQIESEGDREIDV